MFCLFKSYEFKQLYVTFFITNFIAIKTLLITLGKFRDNFLM